MKIDAPLLATDLADVPGEARDIERLGYDGAFTFEGAHDPFFPLALAAEHTTGLELATAIAIAFPRSPMQLANVGHDLQVYSRGRFILGLGSQVKTHIVKRSARRGRGRWPGCGSSSWCCARSGAAGTRTSGSTSGASSTVTR